MEKNHQQPKAAGKDILTVVFFGPESTGKTTLAKNLAAYFNTSWAAEYMREYLQKKWDDSKEVCQIEDLIPIAKGQLQNEDMAKKNAQKLVFFDTNLLQIKVYAEVYYDGFCPPEITREALNRHYDLYLLSYIDVPWEADDLRDKPNDREKMFRYFENELKKQNIPFITLKGGYEQRFETVKAAVKNIVNNP